MSGTSLHTLLAQMLDQWTTHFWYFWPGCWFCFYKDAEASKTTICSLRKWTLGPNATPQIHNPFSWVHGMSCGGLGCNFPFFGRQQVDISIEIPAAHDGRALTRSTLHWHLFCVNSEEQTRGFKHEVFMRNIGRVITGSFFGGEHPFRCEQKGAIQLIGWFQFLGGYLCLQGVTSTEGSDRSAWQTRWQFSSMNLSQNNLTVPVE